MYIPIQHFMVANLIFTTSPEDKEIYSKEDLSKIKEQFEKLLASFLSPDMHYPIGQDKNSSLFPYSSFVRIGRFRDFLILHFNSTFYDPVLFVIAVNQEKKKVRNFIDIKDIKTITREDMYYHLQFTLQSPKKAMDRIFPHIDNINDFVCKYKEELERHKNPNTITGMDCFEFDL